MTKRERKLIEDLAPILKNNALMAVTLHQPEAARVVCGQVKILKNPRGFKPPHDVRFLLVYSSTNRRHWSQAPNHEVPRTLGRSGAYGSLLGIVELKDGGSGNRACYCTQGSWRLKVRARFSPPIIASTKARAGYWTPSVEIQNYIRSLVLPIALGFQVAEKPRSVLVVL